MKRLLPLVPLLLLLCLLLSPAAALQGAKHGMEIWWRRVFPSLQPSFLCVKLSEQLGLLRGRGRRGRGRLFTVIGFSLVSGAPNGTKLLHALVQGGSLSDSEGETLLPLINNISPVFLFSIIASELLKNKALFLPMGLSLYGCILCLLAIILFRKRGALHPARTMEARRIPFSEALTLAIESSMLDMLRIGGCIIFSCTLLALVQSFVSSEGASAALAVALEVSTGVSTLSQLSLPLRLKASLLVGAAAFGGLGLGLQSVCCYPELKLMPYLLKKLFFGGLVGLVCYLLFPHLPGVSSVFADRQEVFQRSLSLSALLLSSFLSVAFIGVLSLMANQRKRDGFLK